MLTFAVIIDYSHLWHICYNAALQAGQQYDLNESIHFHAQGKLRTIKKTLEKENISEYDTIFVEDRVATRKLELWPDYRKNRKDFGDLKTKLKERLFESGHKGKFFHSEGNEADDAIATLVHRANARGGVITVIVTGDRDLWQLISPTTIVLNPIKKAIVKQEDIDKAFECLPHQISLVKALWGDAGDCVPNAVPRTQKYLRPLIKQTKTGTWEEWKTAIAGNWLELPPRCCELYSAGEKQAYINYQLVKLDPNCQLAWD